MSKEYPDNPLCERPKDSGMRKWCECQGCKKYTTLTGRFAGALNASLFGVKPTCFCDIGAGGKPCVSREYCDEKRGYSFE